MINENSDDSIVLKECIVGHIDVLGAKALIEDDEISFISTLKEMIKAAQSLCEVYNQTSHRKFDYKLKIFSDNLCFYAELPETGDEESKKNKWENILYMFFLISAFQYIAILEHKILLRGGISIGNLYYNDDFIIGKALSEAYMLEAKNAVYSRILIDKKIIKENERPTGAKLTDFIMQDTDGNFMLNYLVYAHGAKIFDETQSDNIPKHKEILLEKLNEAKDKSVEAKILSSIYYHNKFCKESGLNNHLIDSKLLHQKFGFVFRIFRVIGNLFK